MVLIGRNKEKLESVYEEVSFKDSNHIAVQMDLSNVDYTYRTVFEKIQNLPNIDLLINNAGVININTIIESSYSDLIGMFNVNVITPILL